MEKTLRSCTKSVFDDAVHQKNTLRRTYFRERLFLSGTNCIGTALLKKRKKTIERDLNLLNVFEREILITKKRTKLH